MRAPEEDYCAACHAIRPGAGAPMPAYPPITHTLTLDRLPPRINEVIGRKWYIIARLKQQLEEAMRIAMLTQDVPKARGRRRVSLKAMLGPRRKQPDRDAYDKMTLDCLTRCGLLLDDSERGLVGRMAVEFERAAKDGSVITLEEMQTE